MVIGQTNGVFGTLLRFLRNVNGLCIWKNHLRVVYCARRPLRIQNVNTLKNGFHRRAISSKPNSVQRSYDVIQSDLHEHETPAYRKKISNIFGFLNKLPRGFQNRLGPRVGSSVTYVLLFRKNVLRKVCFNFSVDTPEGNILGVYSVETRQVKIYLDNIHR